METLKPDATGIYVPAAVAPAAIEEAIEAEVPLVVAVAEHIPLHAMLRIHSMLKTQSATRLVGANSPGIISATGRCRIGFQPLPCFNPGDDGPGASPTAYRIGIAARSGTLSYEAVASTSRAGLSQTLCIGVGGDIVAGTDLREGLAVLADHHPETDAIALIGEIGGDSEMEAAAWIHAYHKRTPENERKPIVALVGGTYAVPGRIMGHAGAFTLPGEPTPQEKIAALERAGATVIDHPEKFGQALKARLDAKFGNTPSSPTGSLFGQPGATQRRGMHTYAIGRRPSLQQTIHSVPSQQKRFLNLGQEVSFDLLRQQGVNAKPYSGLGTQHYLAISIDRSAKSPCVLASPDLQGPVSEPTAGLAGARLRRFPFDYRKGVDGLLVSRVASHLKLDQSSPATTESLRKLLRALYTTFMEQEAFLVETSVVARLSDVKVVQARMGIDDVAFGQRRDAGDRAAIKIADTVATAATDTDPLEVQAKTGGIVYVTLENEGASPTDACIGTLVNGAGLAMNTVDALSGLGGRPANFLDTGGKATSETVKLCFQVLLQDPRVRVIFVNVFGGLTLGDMIARGVLLAFKEVQVTVPVVVRIRGTNEAEGQAIIRDSGLEGVYAYDGFQEAAAKAIELMRSAE